MYALTIITCILGAVTAYTMFAIDRAQGHAFKAVSTDPTCARTYTYRGKDYPRAWCIPPLKNVLTTWENSNHYAMDTHLGAAEWNATLPRVVRLGPDRRPFTVSVFHQLRCLDILREVIVEYQASDDPAAEPSRPALAKHCMNYLRQMVLCRADTTLETVRTAGAHRAVFDVSRVCQDWSAVYSAAEENFEGKGWMAKSHGMELV